MPPEHPAILAVLLQQEAEQSAVGGELVGGGHKRSPPVRKNPRSPGTYAEDLGRADRGRGFESHPTAAAGLRPR
jgi:hypothetical protein